jgi:D-alanine-D-alanine ligase-like ATP-grasp enzyme
VVQSINKETKVEIVTITLLNYKDIFGEFKKKENLVVFNLCDGTEEDGYPGLSIVKELERLSIPFTGAGSYFYDQTTSKVVLKRLLINEQVPTSRFISIRPDYIEEDVAKSDELNEWPLIIKPAVSYASISITDQSVVDNKEDAVKHIKSIINQKNGGVFMETFLAGNEFTALVTGDKVQGTRVYPVAERVFNSRLSDRQKILAFDRCNLFFLT